MIIRAITTGKNNYKLYFDNEKLLKLEFKNNDYFQGYSTWSDYWGINDLDIGEINKIEVDCPTFSGNPNADGEFDLTRIVYDVTWNKCE